MSNIQKRNFEEHVRFLILRYPRNTEKVILAASEYAGTKVSKSEILKIQSKFEKRQNKDTNFWVACNISKEIIQGYMERVAKLEAIFQQWDGKEVVEVSLCHKAPVRDFKYGEPGGKVCLKCHETCETKFVFLTELEQLKLKIIQEMRAESEHLLEFAKQMGFTGNVGPEVVNKNTNYVFVQDNSKTNQQSIAIDPERAKAINEMDPVSREKLIKSLEKQIAQEAEFEENA